MNQILSNNEIAQVVHDIDCAEVRPFDIEFARVIEQAILHKLSEQNKLDALRNDAVLLLDKYQVLCDQLGNALEVSSPLYRENDIDWYEALEAWRALK